MKRHFLFIALTISMCSPDLFGLSVSSTVLKDNSVSEVQQLSPQPANVPGLPVHINFINVEDTADGYTFICSVSNQSDDEIQEMQAYLLVLDEAGDMEYAGNKRQILNASSHETKDWSIDLGCKLDDRARVFIVISEVMGHASRWKVPKADVTLDAYAKGEGYMLPEVIEMKN